MPIEQIAFDYFISKIDSIYITDGGKYYLFDTNSHKIYFSGETAGGGGFNPEALNRYKKTFVTLDSLEDRKPVHSPLEKRPLYSNRAFVVKEKIFDLTPNDSVENISLQISTRCYKNSFYYVIIWIFMGADWVNNEVYIKLDKNGLPIDYLQMWGIE